MCMYPCIYVKYCTLVVVLACKNMKLVLLYVTTTCPCREFKSDRARILSHSYALIQNVENIFLSTGTLLPVISAFRTCWICEVKKKTLPTDESKMWFHEGTALSYSNTIVVNRRLTQEHDSLLCHHSTATGDEYWFLVLEERHLEGRQATNQHIKLVGCENKGHIVTSNSLEDKLRSW